MSGLLFADDLVGISETGSETVLGAEKQAERISEWCCNMWEMGVGIKKCWSHVHVVRDFWW